MERVFYGLPNDRRMPDSGDDGCRLCVIPWHGPGNQLQHSPFRHTGVRIGTGVGTVEPNEMKASFGLALWLGPVHQPRDVLQASAEKWLARHVGRVDAQVLIG